jgi:acetylglutamate kinase
MGDMNQLASRELLKIPSAERAFAKRGNATAGLSEGLTLLINGYGIQIKKSFAELDKARVKHLLERSFGKELAGGYLEIPTKRIFIESNYEGMAIMKEIDGVPYLDKFAVVPEKQGNGLGKALWACLEADYASMIWRSVQENPINGWYAIKSSGNLPMGRWNIFWYGMSAEEGTKLAQDVAELPPTLIK